MKIRKAGIRDISQIASLNYKLNTYHLKFDSYYDLKSDAETILRKQYYKTMLLIKTIHSKKTLLLVAEIDNKIIGYVYGSILGRSDFYKVNRYGYIGGLFVLKEYRRKSVGRKLVYGMLDWFKQNNINYVETKVDLRNKSAVSSWEKYGFVAFHLKMKKKLK